MCAQCRIEIAAGERTERDPECLACADPDVAVDAADVTWTTVNPANWENYVDEVGYD